ncbi:MAG: hypothetical protein LBK62_10750 [Treponema sp.]|jgi:hypothetical protein|nr:hypothetical protein [Treponema sp.]
MKKTFIKLGAAAIVLTLALVFASCAQPTEEGSSGPNAPTIIRLYLDRDDATLVDGNIIQFRVGEELQIGVANYPAAVITDSAGTAEPGAKTGAIIEPVDRTRVIAIPWDRAHNVDTVLSNQNPKKKFLDSGLITLKPTYAGGDGGSTIQVNAKGVYYVDVELINQTVASKDRGSIFDASISGYVELVINTAAQLPVLPGGGANPWLTRETTYLYTADKHGFNDRWKLDPDGFTNIWATTNKNIKKVSLKPGVNELYLSYFSHGQSEQN